MSKVVSALVGIEAFQELAQSPLKPFDGPFGGRAEERFEFGEGQFDGIEVRAVGRQIDELRPDVFDGFADPGDLVSGQIVHHDDVPRAQRRRKLLLDVAEKHVAVHRAVDHGGRRETREPQGADEGRRLPMAVRDMIHDALAAKASAVQPRELRMGAEFVEKRQPPDIEMRLPKPPALAAIGDVRTQLLSGMNDFF